MLAKPTEVVQTGRSDRRACAFAELTTPSARDRNGEIFLDASTRSSSRRWNRLPDYLQRKLTLPGFRHQRVRQKPGAARQPVRTE